MADCQIWQMVPDLGPPGVICIDTPLLLWLQRVCGSKRGENAARSARASRTMRPDPAADAGTRQGPKTGPKTSKTRKITVSGAKMGQNAPNAPFWAPKRPKTGQNRRLSDTKMAISRARRKIGRGPGAQNARRIQRNKKGRRSVSPILQNSVRINSGQLGPLKSAEKQAKMGAKNGLFGPFSGVWTPRTGSGGPKTRKSAKNQK